MVGHKLKAFHVVSFAKEHNGNSTEKKAMIGELHNIPTSPKRNTLLGLDILEYGVGTWLCWERKG